MYSPTANLCKSEELPNRHERNIDVGFGIDIIIIIILNLDIPLRS